MKNSQKQLELLKLGEKISNKIFNSSKEKLICHPEALPAFEAWSTVKKHNLKHDAVPDQMKELYSSSTCCTEPLTHVFSASLLMEIPFDRRDHQRRCNSAGLPQVFQ